VTITAFDTENAESVGLSAVTSVTTPAGPAQDAQPLAGAVATSSAELADLLDEETITALVASARAQAAAGGLRLLGEDGLLASITKRVIEAALEEEMAEHLEPGNPTGSGADGGSNERNGRRRKTVLTEVGPVAVAVPRDRNGSFAPAVVAKHARRTSGIDELVISLAGKGLTTGEIAAHLAEVYDITTSKETVSTITDRVLDGMNEWRTRPLDPVYPVVMIDAIHVKIRDGQVANRPIYAAIAVTCDGIRDVLGLWVGDGGEGAKYWGQVCTELKNRGLADICILICDGLSGLPEAVNQVWPRTVVQTCIIHLLRASFRYAARNEVPAIARDLRPVYTAPTEAAALDRFAEFAATWEAKYPAIVKLWERSWAEMVPFLAFDREIRSVICSTNAIESLNARYRRAARASGHFPNEQAALKRLYLATLALDPTGKGRVRWSNRWKAALGAFDVTFDGRVSAGRR
jgi:putative transposase